MNASLYLLLNGAAAGPYAAASVKIMWESGAVNGFTMCCVEGSEQWVPLRTFADDLGINPAPAQPVAVAAPPPQIIVQQVKPRFGCVAALGVVCVVVGVVLCFTGFGIIFGAPLAVVGLLAMMTR